ncbi:PorP/SprF family type IX secretion system membrane protein, partial [Flavivirga jejuensis]
MKTYLLHIVLFLCFTQQFHTQEEDGVVSFVLPVRNSLKFNRYAINPTFSFVREQNKYISFNNKRQWAQFEDAPQTYLFGYSGRFRENIGAGIGLFQQNYGVFSTFGGILNFAYNVVLNRDSNLTFGMNLGFYKSGINEGKVITNFPDPSLDNIPSNSLITANPGINYGTDFLDFGLSLNNIFLYNLNTSKIVEEDPEQSVQAHIMYTGYADTRGFFDESKFSGLIKTEFKKDKTVISGIAMLTVPKGIWAQAGYNTLYGLSIGLGLNISTQISIEYNYEKAIGDLLSFGNSHDITLAYKFKNRYRYAYSGDDEEASIIIPDKRRKRSTVRRRTSVKSKVPVKRKTAAEVKAAAAARAKLLAETKAKEIAERSRKTAAAKAAAAEAKAKADAEAARAKAAAAEAKAKADAEAARAKAAAEAKAKADAEAARAKAAAEAKAKADAEAARAKAAAEAKAKADAEAARAKAAAEAKAKADAEAARAKAVAEAKAKADAEAARAKAAAEAKAKADAEAARAKAAAEAKAKADAEAARAKAAVEAKAKADAEAARAKAAAEAKAKADAEAARAKAAAEAKAKADAEAARAKAA